MVSRNRQDSQVEFVDLATTDRTLEDLMLSKYPGVLMGPQISKTKLPQGKTRYLFCHLEKTELENFLNNYKPSEYTIICHTDS